jgi:hypothetical protein
MRSNTGAGQQRSKATESKLSVLQNRNFTLLWVGSVISNSGSWMQIVAQGWLVYNLTGSAFALGVVGMVLSPIGFPG